MNHRKSEHSKHCRDVRERLYAAMDRNLGFKENTLKQEKRKDIINIPELCRDCKFIKNLCYINKIKQQGVNFNCTIKIHEIQKEEENEKTKKII